MKHLTTKQWTDFGSEVVSTNSNQDMEKQPTQDCMACNQAFSKWRRVHAAPSAETDYQPSAEALRFAKTPFASSNLAFGRRRVSSLAEVLFDSSLQPVAKGVRSTGSGARQIVYRAGRYQIDVQIEMGSDRQTLVVTGQVQDLKRPRFSGRDVLVVISNLRGQLELTTTNQFGEFRKEIPDSGDLELFFPSLPDKMLMIGLRDPLRRSAAERRLHVVRNSQARRKIGKNPRALPLKTLKEKS